MTTDDAKRALAARARKTRRAAHAAQGVASALAVRDHVMAWLQGGACTGAGRGAVVAGYWPKGDELDTGPLLEALDAAGYVCALPAVTGTDAVLAFRRWRRGDMLAAGRFGIMEPGAEAETVTPAVVIAPLLAFDAAGYRLGYGAGYYDRTLRALRDDGTVTAVGIGFAAQAVAAVPHDGADERLDWTITEDGAVRTGP